ncbi:hypothetical protein [Shewanella algae]|uniref:hypothetical protein n=1 Tax=Shewanella algae TaxID=38313 RepID=UPI0012DED6AA|nr:hypothetical protein [Shewanella algae]QGS59029.1 hypothetical protein GMX02_05515 [Shewanella algae]
MYLLQAMTGATSETRLVLLTWLALLGEEFQSETRDNLASKLGVNKRHLGEALEYLVREGFLWKMKTPSKRSLAVRAKVRFGYGVTTESLNMWKRIISTCNWTNELVFVLKSTNLKEVNLSTNKSVTVSPNMRLVLALLILAANDSGYVFGFENQILCMLVGMTKSKFTRVIQALSKTELIHTIIQNDYSSVVFGRLSPMYQIKPQFLGRKCINLGLFLSMNYPTHFNFFYRLDSYYSRAVNSLKRGKSLPNSKSELDDEMYFKLSKNFSDRKLVLWAVNQCLSIIFKLASVHAKETMMNSSRCSVANLYSQVRSELDVQISNVDKLKLHDLVIIEVEGGENPSYSRDEDLIEYTFHVLSPLIVGIVEELVNPLKSLYEKLGYAHIVNFLPYHHMIVVNQESANSEDCLTSSNWFAPCVFEIAVSDEAGDGDVVIVSDHIFTNNSRVEGSNVSRVEKIICCKKGRVF